MRETEHDRRLRSPGRRYDVGDRQYDAPGGSRGTLSDRATTTDRIRGDRPSCPHCARRDFCRWGSDHRGNPRWCCRGCSRTFGSSTGTVLAGLRSPDKFAYVVEDMLGTAPGSCRKLAAELGVDKTTVWEWRLKIARRLQGERPVSPVHRLRITQRPLRESRKGSREWVRHARDPARFAAPDRPRWVDVDRLRLKLPLPIAAYQLHALVVVDGRGNHPEIAPLGHEMPESSGCATIMVAGEACSHAAGWGDDVACWRGPSFPPLNRDPTGPDRSGQAFEGVATGAAALLQDRADGVELQCSDNCQSGACPLCHGDAAPPRALPIDAAGDLSQRFARFIRTFRGPAAKYMKGYVAWFIARLESDEAGRLVAAWVCRSCVVPDGRPTPNSDMLHPASGFA